MTAKEKSEMGGNVTAYGVDPDDEKSKVLLKKIDAALNEIFAPLNPTERTIALQLFSIRQVTSTMAHKLGLPRNVCASLFDSAITIARFVPKEIADRKKIADLCRRAEKEVMPIVEEMEHDANCPHCNPANSGALGDLAKIWKGDSAPGKSN